MFLIPPDSLSRLLVVMVATVVEKMNFFAVLDPLIKTFMQVALVIGPLSSRTYTLEVMRKENQFNSDSNYPENFWPKILTLLCIGASDYLTE